MVLLTLQALPGPHYSVTSLGHGSGKCAIDCFSRAFQVPLTIILTLTLTLTLALILTLSVTLILTAPPGPYDSITSLGCGSGKCVIGSSDRLIQAAVVTVPDMIL